MLSFRKAVLDADAVGHRGVRLGRACQECSSFFEPRNLVENLRLSGHAFSSWPGSDLLGSPDETQEVAAEPMDDPARFRHAEDVPLGGL